MIILQTNSLTKSFGVDPILTDIDIQIQSRDRIGLVGINGAGKSTLLKIISGKMQQDSGNIQIAKGTKLGYLAQDSGLETNRTIWDEMKSVFSDLIEKEKYIRHLEAKMSQPSVMNHSNEYEKLLDEYAKYIEDFKEEGGYAYEAQIRSILHGLGFQSYDYNTQQINTLSGGQKTRLALAKLLLEEPNILILDEPTNYLDVETLNWLENYLKSYSGAIFIVSHDRYFLDALATITYELENTRIKRYVGNYSQFMDEKAKQIEMQMKKYEKQQSEIGKLEDFIQKNIARASTTRRAQSRKKMLERLDRIDLPTNSQKAASFSFDTSTSSGNIVLKVQDLSMHFGKQKLFQDVTVVINKQERVALIGPNGNGKSTLFKIIAKKDFEPTTGEVQYGSNVKIGYYGQEQDDLHYDKTIIDELWDEYPILSESEIRTTLGNFLFTGDDVFKKIKDLSGGEKARVSLAKLILEKANFLLLDEPTNHLDIFSREVLENALIDFPGTILFISHDRYFLNRISTRTVELSSEGLANYLGNYSYYLEKKAEIEESQHESLGVNDEKNNKNQYLEDRNKQKQERQLKRKIESIEVSIDEMEELIKKLENDLLQPEVYSNHQQSYAINEELVEAKDRLEKLLLEWEETQQELEG